MAEEIEFKAKRRRLKVTIDEDVYHVNFPTVDQGWKMREKEKELGDDEDQKAEAMKSFLAELGLPWEAASRMELNDLPRLVAVLTDNTEQKKS